MNGARPPQDLARDQAQERARRTPDRPVPLIEAEGITVRRGKTTILADVSFAVAAGETVALVGPNGAGKSTLLGALSGDLPHAAGAVRLEGRPLERWRAAEMARVRGVLLQDNSISFAFTAREIVAMGRSPWAGIASDEEDKAAVAAAVAQTHIEEFLDRPFHHLSGGERARVSLARVLAQSTPVLLLDEPTAALDMRHQEDVMEAAVARAREGSAVVLVLHDLSLAAAYADRVAIVSDRGIVADGAPAAVFTEPLLSRVYGCKVRVLRAEDGHIMVGADRRP